MQRRSEKIVLTPALRRFASGVAAPERTQGHLAPCRPATGLEHALAALVPAGLLLHRVEALAGSDDAADHALHPIVALAAGRDAQLLIGGVTAR
jgi:hypothetical protein